MKILMMDSLLSHHSPMITNRLEFFPQNIGPPPIITSTIDFAKRLANKERNCTTEDSTDDNDGDSDAMDINNASSTIDPSFCVDSNSVAEETGVDSNSVAEETGDLVDIVDKKIPKPRGQVGHPGSGGYSIDFVL